MSPSDSHTFGLPEDFEDSDDDIEIIEHVLEEVRKHLNKKTSKSEN